MATTQEGGIYRVDDRLVDANGKEVKEKSEGGEDSTGALEGVEFASGEAEVLARSEGLAATDFEGQQGSGANGGFTKADVRQIADAKEK